MNETSMEYHHFGLPNDAGMDAVVTIHRSFKELFEGWPTYLRRRDLPPLLIECAQAESGPISITPKEAFYLWKTISGFLGDYDSRGTQGYIDMSRIVGLELVYAIGKRDDGNNEKKIKMICAMQLRASSMGEGDGLRRNR